MTIVALIVLVLVAVLGLIVGGVIVYAMCHCMRTGLPLGWHETPADYPSISELTVVHTSWEQRLAVLLVLSALLTGCATEAAQIADADAQAAPYDAQAEIAKAQLETQMQLAALQITAQAAQTGLQATQYAETTGILQGVIETQQIEQRNHSLILPLATILGCLIVVAGLIWSSIVRRPTVIVERPPQSRPWVRQLPPDDTQPLHINPRQIVPAQRNGRREL